MKKSLFIVLALAMILSCFGIAMAQSEVRVLVRPDEGAVFEKYVPLFEQETGIKVSVDFIGWDSLSSKTATTLAGGGGGYDVVFMPSADATKLIAGGWFEPLNDLMAGEEGEWVDAIVSYYSDEDGNLLGYPWYAGASHWVYNQAILDAAGIDPEKLESWEDITAACEVVKEAGVAEWCMTPATLGNANFYFGWGSIARSFGGKFFDDAGEITLDNPEVIASLKWLEDGVKNGYLNAEGIGLSDYDTLVSYGQGSTVFMVNSTWSTTQAVSNPELSKPFESSYATLMPGTNETYLYAGAFGLLKASTNKEAAKQFIAYITGEEAQKTHALDGGNLPTRTALFEDAEIAAKWKNYDALADQLNYGDFAPKLAWFDEWRMQAGTMVQFVLKGEMTAEEALQWLADETAVLIADAE